MYIHRTKNKNKIKNNNSNNLDYKIKKIADEGIAQPATPSHDSICGPPDDFEWNDFENDSICGPPDDLEENDEDDRNTGVEEATEIVHENLSQLSALIKDKKMWSRRG